MAITIESAALLQLLQLANPALPVGAYSYSEGLETLVDQAIIDDAVTLAHWLTQELTYGAVRLEAAVMVRGYQAMTQQDYEQLHSWNQWLSAVRESEELRAQSWQMGRSLLRLGLALQINQSESRVNRQQLAVLQADSCNFAIAFGLLAASYQIGLTATLLGYLQSWATNLIGAGIKLIPLGQTVGQQLLVTLHPQLEHSAAAILALTDDELSSCGWGLALASMAHETQYSRLFRS